MRFGSHNFYSVITHHTSQVNSVEEGCTSCLNEGCTTNSLLEFLRFHQLPEFDQGKRSCRRRLAGHNERRRKAPPGPLATRYGRLAASFGEQQLLICQTCSHRSLLVQLHLLICSCGSWCRRTRQVQKLPAGFLVPKSSEQRAGCLAGRSTRLPDAR